MSKTMTFIIDLAQCTGCHACSIACKDRAGLPDETDWLRVETHESGDFPQPVVYFRPVHCFHCAAPPCADVCPTGAIARQSDGLVQLDTWACTGCGVCAATCPFHVVVMLPTGLATKCDGCADEVIQGVEPTCVRACPMRALGYEPVSAALPANRVRDPDFEDVRVGPAVLYVRRSVADRQ